MRQTLAQEHTRTLDERMHSPQHAEAYARHCPVPRAETGDYLLRELEPEPGLRLLAGIHFRGLDTRHPFVGVYAQSAPLTATRLPRLSEWLGRQFGMFRPPRVRWWWPGDGAELQRLAGAVPDQRLVVGRLAELRERQRPPAAGLELVPDPQLECYEWYRSQHERFLAMHPQWRGRITPEDRNSLSACAALGTLYEARVDGRRAGLIAARPETLRGVPGWVMVEELLAEEYRGRGLGPALQRELIERLEAAREPLLLGTIDAYNLASLRTAERCGRLDLGGWLYLQVGR